MNAMTEVQDPLVFTDNAANKVKELISEEGNQDLKLRVFVSGGSDTALTLNLITNQTYSCARDFVIPALNVYQLLPDTGTVQVSIPAQAKGSKLFFTCSMGMYTGQIVFQ